VVILLVSKLPAGKLVNDPLLLLKLRKKPFPTVVMLLVSKLPAGKLVNAPLELKFPKKAFPTFVGVAPKCDIAGIWLTYTLSAVVPDFGTRGLLVDQNVHLLAAPAQASVMM
jgi:hypothetical protein